MRYILFSLLVSFLICCSENSIEQSAREYKDEFLNLAEFDCKGIVSEYYIQATIDNMEYCTNTDDNIKNQIHLFSSFVTTGPSTDSSTVVSGSSARNIWFGLYADFVPNTRVKHLFFISESYPDSYSKLDIAEDVFVEGKKWSVSGFDTFGKGISVLYRYTDGRENYNTSHYVESIYGVQEGKSIKMKKVNVRKEGEYIYYSVEMTFEADLYIKDSHGLESSLFAEVREGKMVAEFKVKR